MSDLLLSFTHPSLHSRSYLSVQVNVTVYFSVSVYVMTSALAGSNPAVSAVRVVPGIVHVG